MDPLRYLTESFEAPQLFLGGHTKNGKILLCYRIAYSF